MALDLGIENPEPAGKPEPLRMSVPDDGSNGKIDFDARRKALKEAQQKFAEAAKTSSSEAASGVAAEEIRVYRDGSFPAVGKNAASTLLKAKAGKMSFEPMGGDMSDSADLACTYGKYSVSRDGNAEAGHFFQIWQTDAVGMWKLVVDWQQALPPEKPQRIRISGGSGWSRGFDYPAARDRKPLGDRAVLSSRGAQTPRDLTVANARPLICDSQHRS